MTNNLNSLKAPRVTPFGKGGRAFPPNINTLGSKFAPKLGALKDDESKTNESKENAESKQAATPILKPSPLKKAPARRKSVLGTICTQVNTEEKVEEVKEETKVEETKVEEVKVEETKTEETPESVVENNETPADEKEAPAESETADELDTDGLDEEDKEDKTESKIKTKKRSRKSKKEKATDKSEEVTDNAKDTVEQNVTTITIPHNNMSFEEMMASAFTRVKDENWENFEKEIIKENQNITIEFDMDEVAANKVESQIATLRGRLELLYCDLQSRLSSLTNKDCEGQIDRIKILHMIGANDSERKRNAIMAVMTAETPDGNKINLYEVYDEIKYRYNFVNTIMKSLDNKHSAVITILNSKKITK